MTLARSMLGDDAIRAIDGGFELDIHLNWYRSLPVSSVATIELTVAGEEISRDEITVDINGSPSGLDEVAARWMRNGSCSAPRRFVSDGRSSGPASACTCA